LDRSEFRTAARDLLQRHITESEKAPEPEPTRPEQHYGTSQAWLGQGDMRSENRAAVRRDQQINRGFYEFRAREGGEAARAQLAQVIDNFGRTPPPGGPTHEDIRQQFKAAAREVTTPQDGPPRSPNAERQPAPETGPERPPPAAAAKSREALNQHVDRTEKPIRDEMRQAAREALQRNIETPERGQTPNPDRPRGLER